MKALRLLGRFTGEILSLAVLLFCIFQYLGQEQITIKSDGAGYYDYLPSIFVHHDLNRLNTTPQTNPELYDRIKHTSGYVPYGDKWVDKYTAGTAVLVSPFYLLNTLWFNLDSGTVVSGLEPSFQNTMFYSTLFYLFLALYFMRRLLSLYQIKKPIIWLSQGLIALATPVTNYASYDPSFSHIYSLFAICAFLYFSRSFFKHQKLKAFLWACLFLGLIFILRQLNIIILLFLPFIAGSWSDFKSGIKRLFIQKSLLLTGGLLALIPVVVQCVLWYLQTGHFIVYSYQSEGFNFSSPEFFNILFSYRKGLFVYTPIVFIASLGLIPLWLRKQRYLVFTWLIFFVVLTYLLSSWHSWYYGASFGMRPYIEFLPIFFIVFALSLQHLNSKWLFWSAVVLSVITIPLNIIQTFQYKNYILHWDGMDRQKYWEVFLKTDSAYRLYLWKESYNPDQFDLLKPDTLGDFIVAPKTYQLLGSDTLSAEISQKGIDMIAVKLNNPFYEIQRAKIELTLHCAGAEKPFYFFDVPLIQFSNNGLSHLAKSSDQAGIYWYKISKPDESGRIVVTLTVNAMGNKSINTEINDLSLSIFHRKD